MVRIIRVTAILVYVVFVTGFSSFAFADFAVRSAQQSDLPYGNAETRRFHEAIVGAPLDPCEEQELMGEIPFKETGHYYLRANVNSGRLTLDQLKNDSPTISGDIGVRRVGQNQVGLELAVGYFWSPTTRAELEYLVNKNFNFTADPILAISPPQTMTGEIKNNTLLVNGYYEFKAFERFKPYVMLGIGLASNSTSSSLSPDPAASGDGSSNRLITFAWGAGIGFRVLMLSRWSIDLRYRYVNLGQMKFQPNSSMLIRGTLSMSAISAGIIFAL